MVSGGIAIAHRKEVVALALKELAPDAERRELAMVPLKRNERIIDNILTKYIEMNAKTPLMLTSAYDFCSVRFANAFCWSARSITAGR